MCESPQCYQGFYQTQRGEFDFDFFQSRITVSSPRYSQVNDAVGLSAAQVLLPKVSCEALRATRTKQINHFCDDFEKPLS